MADEKIQMMIRVDDQTSNPILAALVKAKIAEINELFRIAEARGLTVCLDYHNHHTVYGGQAPVLAVAVKEPL